MTNKYNPTSYTYSILKMRYPGNFSDACHLRMMYEKRAMKTSEPKKMVTFKTYFSNSNLRKLYLNNSKND